MQRASDLPLTATISNSTSAEAPRHPAGHQIDAIDFAEAFQPRSEIHRIAEQRVIEVLVRAEIADDAFPGVEAIDRPGRGEARGELSSMANAQFSANYRRIR